MPGPESEPLVGGTAGGLEVVRVLSQLFTTTGDLVCCRYGVPVVHNVGLAGIGHTSFPATCIVISPTHRVAGVMISTHFIFMCLRARE